MLVLEEVTLLISSLNIVSCHVPYTMSHKCVSFIFFINFLKHWRYFNNFWHATSQGNLTKMTTLWVKKTRNPTHVDNFEILIDFQNSFTARLSTKFATKWALYIPPYINDVAALLLQFCVWTAMIVWYNMRKIHCNLVIRSFWEPSEMSNIRKRAL